MIHRKWLSRNQILKIMHRPGDWMYIHIIEACGYNLLCILYPKGHPNTQ